MLVKATEDCFHIGFRNKGDIFNYEEEDFGPLPSTMVKHDGTTAAPVVQAPVTLAEFADGSRNKRKSHEYESAKVR